MLRLITLLTFFLVVKREACCQKGQFVLEKLLSDGASEYYVGFDGARYLYGLEPPIDVQDQYFIKGRNALYLFINGTGRLYRVLVDAGAVRFERMDSTLHFGYNIGSFPFFYNDSIYNLGGYGLWRINGQLRVFVPRARQWDIVKLNEERPLMYGEDHTLLWYDQSGEKIFLGLSMQRNEAIKDSSLNQTKFEYDVAVLDLTTKNWSTIGTLDAYLKENLSLLRNITSSPWGQLCILGNKFLVIDYRNNRLLSFRPATEDRIIKTLAPYVLENLFFFRDSTLYVANADLGRLDSFSLGQKDLIYSQKRVYGPVNPGLQKDWARWPLLLLLGVSVFLLVIRVFLKKRNFRGNSPSPSVILEKLLQQRKSIFDQRETDALKLIYDKSKMRESATIEELNSVLGLAKRSFQAQKKQRSEVIASIRSKLFYLDPNLNAAIKRKQSDFDKRSFEYFIDEVDLSKIEKHLNNQT